jgi:LacI family transcriptional regulator
VHERATVEAEVARLLALPDPPTAIFSSNARTSMLLVHAIPRDELAVVGFGDFPMADVLRPALTVIDQDPDQIGRSAATRVFERVDHPKRRLRRTTILDVKLIERESCRTAQP